MRSTHAVNVPIVTDADTEHTASRSTRTHRLGRVLTEVFVPSVVVPLLSLAVAGVPHGRCCRRCAGGCWSHWPAASSLWP